MNFVDESANYTDVYLMTAYDIIYMFKIQVSFDSEWLDFSESQSIVLNAPTIENSFYGNFMIRCIYPYFLR